MYSKWEGERAEGREGGRRGRMVTIKQKHYNFQVVWRNGYRSSATMDVKTIRPVDLLSKPGQHA